MTTLVDSPCAPSDDDPAVVARAYEDALDDVHTRFLLNLPEEELATPDRIFFQLEQAWWFYDDFICDHSSIALPRFKSLRPFAVKMFEISPILQPMRLQFDQLWDHFSKYKRTISTYGTILLNQACTKVVLCQAWNSKSWTFPAGKINQNEAGREAGARETYEETGFDPNCNFGLAYEMKKQNGELPWKSLQEEDALVYIDEKGKRRTCYVCRGVPEDFPFAPVARKEVSDVAWHSVDALPKKSFAVLPFITQMRRWIQQQQQQSNSSSKKSPKKKRAGSTKKPRSRNNSRGKVRDTDPLLESGLANPGDLDGWTEEDMFQTNEKLLGRKITYDGNPHHFTEKGFDGKDPHAFHVVGGTFMNSGSGIAQLAPPPDRSKLQPLFRRQQSQGSEHDSIHHDDDDDHLEPFFSHGGETPWGDVVAEALAMEVTQSIKKETRKTKKVPPVALPDSNIEASQALMTLLRSGGKEETAKAISDDDDMANAIILTDAEITLRSQQEKAERDATKILSEAKSRSGRTARHETFNIEEWVKTLPQSPATTLFGDFRFDMDAILTAMTLQS